MILSPDPTFPSSRRYVLKLHRDADPASGKLIGRIENVSSGHEREFRTASELIAAIVADAELGDRPLKTSIVNFR